MHKRAICTLAASVVALLATPGYSANYREPSINDKQSAWRTEALRKQQTRDEERLEIESVTLTPQEVRPGGTVDSVVQYTALSSRENAGFLITETCTLVGERESFQLARRQIARQRGTHTSRMRFTVPPDIVRGEYTLFVTITNGKHTLIVSRPLAVAEASVPSS